MAGPDGKSCTDKANEMIQLTKWLAFSCLKSGQNSSKRQKWHHKTNGPSWQWFIYNLFTTSHFRHVSTEKCRWLLCPHTVTHSVAKTNQLTSVNRWCTGFVAIVKPVFCPPGAAFYCLPQSNSQGTRTKLLIKIMQTPNEAAVWIYKKLNEWTTIAETAHKQIKLNVN